MNEETPVKGFKFKHRPALRDVVISCEAVTCQATPYSAIWPLTNSQRANLMQHRANHKPSDYTDQVLPWADEEVFVWIGPEGRTIRDDDLRYVVEFTKFGRGEDSRLDRVRDALDPKPAMCNAGIRMPHGITPLLCVLPVGHHPYERPDSSAYLCLHRDERYGAICGGSAANPIHSPGHMTAQEAWVEG